MGLGHSPKVVTDGLLLNFDAANAKSFKGVPATNVLTAINYGYGESNTSVFKITNSSENVYIPALKTYVTSKYIDVYNDYNGGSGACCLNLYSFGTSLAVSGSTTYTYSIIYKTRTGYTHPNYMYRYEYTSGDVYVTEAGVHNTGNRISLGDGWYYAWGQFTTQPTTAKLSTYLFHYEYATQNRVYVYKAAIYLGSTVLPVDQMLSPGEVRGATVATGGGLADLSGRGNHGELVNGPTYDANNRGSIVFDGINDTVTTNIPITSTPALGNWTYEVWTSISAFPTAVSPANVYGRTDRDGVLLGAAYYSGAAIYWDGVSTADACNVFAFLRGADAYRYTASYSMALNTIYQFVMVNNYSGNAINFYVNGVLYATAAAATQEYDSNLTPTAGNIGLAKAQVDGGGTGNYSNYPGRIYNAKIYSAALTAAQVAQNFNALRGRYGI